MICAGPDGVTVRGSGCCATTVDAVALPDPPTCPDINGYGLDGDVRVIAINGGVDINGGPAIACHGDISNPTTWWALRCLTAATTPG
jgi:hypothetical protein